ncbi:hypothetical protein AAFP30_12830 [Gordonia sp. CPCC 205515]|uniref:hypothetical protein n=1 Tax=Gordonia sp. CPCC 205515 TaxID=3140791 RepID=UPI003AF3A054
MTYYQSGFDHWASTGIEVTQHRTFGAVVILVLNGLMALMFTLAGLSVLLGGTMVVGGLVFLTLGILLTWASIAFGRRVLATGAIARIDRFGVTFMRIRDERFRSWTWAEMLMIHQRTTRSSNATIRDLVFVPAPSPRVAAFEASLPTRNWFGMGRRSQVDAALTIRFSAGVRPKRDNTVALLRTLTPAGLLH